VIYCAALIFLPLSSLLGKNFNKNNNQKSQAEKMSYPAEVEKVNLSLWPLWFHILRYRFSSEVKKFRKK
jgi:hypothetical protein